MPRGTGECSPGDSPWTTMPGYGRSIRCATHSRIPVEGWAQSTTTAAAALGAEGLPKEEPDESVEVEPPLLIPNRSNEPLSDAVGATKLEPRLDPDRLEKDLERAKKSAVGAERLFKIGALAKVEVE